MSATVTALPLVPSASTPADAAPRATPAIVEQAAPAPAKRGPSLHIPSLDGLRAISFLIVFIAHSGLAFLPAFPGGFGVTVFFFLSGYLITTLLRLERESTGTVSIRNFYLRRALRILPPFYLILGLATLLTAVRFLPGDLHLDAVAAQALHVSNYWFIFHGYDGAPAGTVPYWSLAVEEHFYLVFPVLYIVLSRSVSRRNQAIALWGLCALVCLWRCALVLGIGVPEDRTYMGSDTRFDSILFGCALAVGLNPMLDRPLGGERIWKWGLLPAALGLLLFTFLYRAPWFRETIRYSLQGLALTPVFITAIRFPAWLPFRVLNWKPVAFVGVLSYTLYLGHQVVMMALHHWLPRLDRLLTATLALVIAFVVSVVIHRFIEKPSARLRQRLARGTVVAREAAVR